MCKIERRLIISNSLTSELEITMIFLYFVLQPLITKYRHLNTLIPVFAIVRSPCISTVDFTHVLLKPNFEVRNNTLIACFLPYFFLLLTEYKRNITIQMKTLCVM